METIWIADHRLARLQSAGLATFEQVMATTAGQCKRVLSDRENWYLRGGDSVHGTQYSVLSTRVKAADQCDPSPGFYLKKHRGRSWLSWLAALLRFAPPRSAGRIEAENALALNSLGIAVMPLTAYGEKLHADGRLESFLLSEELEGYCELQDFIEQRFSREGKKRELHRLIVQVAGIARRFHAAGFNHRDFYSCHFLAKEVSSGTFDVRLIDLQRVQRRRWFRRRWIVKDLAQLASMSPGALVGCREKVLFLRNYLGVNRLRPHDKRLIRSVLRKLAAMRRHRSPTRNRVGEAK
jgi:hypothetical protein